MSFRYRDYRNNDDYSYSVQFWHVFAARLAFLIIFEVSVMNGASASSSTRAAQATSHSIWMGKRIIHLCQESSMAAGVRVYALVAGLSEEAASVVVQLGTEGVSFFLSAHSLPPQLHQPPDPFTSHQT